MIRRGWVVFREDGAAGLDRIEDAVGNASGFYGVEESSTILFHVPAGASA